MHGQTESGCQTTDTAFYVYGIPHGQRLRTGTRLRFADADFEAVLAAFYKRVARYTCVYRELADENRDDSPGRSRR